MRVYKDEGVIAFFSYKDFLSNHYKSMFVLDGHVFGSVEQAMMYKKAELFEDYIIMEKLLHESFPPKCKNLGRQVKNFNSKIWDEKKYEIVRNCVEAKFTQNNYLKEKLLKTDGYMLVEASPYDGVWGVKIPEYDYRVTNINQWKGKNLLGEILMDVRTELIYDEMEKGYVVIGNDEERP